MEYRRFALWFLSGCALVCYAITGLLAWLSTQFASALDWRVWTPAVFGTGLLAWAGIILLRPATLPPRGSPQDRRVTAWVLVVGGVLVGALAGLDFWSAAQGKNTPGFGGYAVVLAALAVFCVVGGIVQLRRSNAGRRMPTPPSP